MIVLGISAFYHDSAAAIVQDGRVIAAAQEERFTRKKADADFPINAVRYCLDAAGLTMAEVDKIGFYDKPLLTFDRLLETYMAFAPRGFTSFARAIPIWVKEKVLQKALIRDQLNSLEQGEISESHILFGFHHHSHAASAFYPSPFDSAAILVMDGVGEWATTTIGVGRGTAIDLMEEIRFPHSLGMLYSAFTYYLGFKVNDGEYKVMGLAPYGEPRFADIIRDKLIDVRDDGSFRMDMQYFDYCTGLTMTNAKFDALFGAPPRRDGTPFSQRDMDLARSVQVVLEEIVLKLAHTAHDMTGEKNLVLAGGVALNCVANGRVLREGPFDDIWIQPASGDAGGALGVALEIDYRLNGSSRPSLAAGTDAMAGSYLGPEFGDDDIRVVLDDAGAVYDYLEDEMAISRTVDMLAAEGVVGWFQGRMEFGPRALGNRSILGDPRSSKMQRTLNLKIKYREGFRPFAPAVLAEDVADYFELKGSSPYMLLVADVKSERLTQLSDDEKARAGIDKLHVVRSDIPAVTHVDNSARVQTVAAGSNPRFHSLLSAFKAQTGCAVLVNTSFNVRDEPVVCSPRDAYQCFMATEMDMLVLGNFVLEKARQ